MGGLILFILLLYLYLHIPNMVILGFIWGLIVFVSKLVSYCFQVYSEFFKNDNFEEGFFALLFVPLVAVGRVSCIFQSVSIAWNFPDMIILLGINNINLLDSILSCLSDKQK